ncbi:MAG: MopE-related protein, partial [Bacteroidota bacterium]
MKKRLFQKMLLLAMALLSSQFSNGQLINGDFETNISSGCNYNLINSDFNANMSGCFGQSVGFPGEIDVQTQGCYVEPQSGLWCIGLACSGSTTHDAIALQLSNPLVVGQSYTINFYAYKNSYTSGDASINVGLSNTSSLFGTTIYTSSNSLNDTWVLHSVNFTANSADMFITVSVDGGTYSLSTWYQFDNFSITSSSAIAGCTNPSACNYDAAATSDNGSCTYPVGDPSIFPQDSWNLYAYNGSGFTTYRGFVNIGSALNYNTENLYYFEAESPSFIAGYAGCPVTIDDHSYSIKRQGFPEGNYTFALYNWDDVASVYVDGTQIMNYACCGFWAGTQYYFNLNLNANSTVEVRLQEGEYGSRIHFELIANITGCTNPSACNYNAAATADDGSCTFASLYYPDADADGYGDSDAGISGNYTVQSVPFTMETPSIVNQGPVCDDCTQSIPIGFDFSFYGVQYSNLTISSNGYVTFDNTGNSGCCSGELIPQFDGVNNGIYLGRSDWFPYTGGLITYYNLSSPNRLVVEYSSVPRCCDEFASDIMSGQMVIFENGQIQLNISYLNHASNVVTIGVENQQGTLAAGPGQLFAPISVTNTSYLFTYSTGNGGEAVYACTQPAGYVNNNIDCDDAVFTTNPGASEICINGVDDNCSGVADENCPILGCTDATACNYDAAANTNDGSCTYPSTYYVDADGDGYGSYPGLTTQGTSSVVFTADGLVINGSNIANSDGSMNVEGAASFTVPADGVFTFDWTYVTTDVDGPGYDPAYYINGVPVQLTDDQGADSQNGSVSVAVTAGSIFGFSVVAEDNILGQATLTITNFNGIANFVGLQACTQPAGYVSNNDDCNDSNSAVNPGAIEICNANDDDCDGIADDGVVLTTYYQDMDFDGFGGSNTTDACFPPNPSYIAQGGDCEDFNPSVNPSATEVCNSSDDNCNSQIDEGLTFVDYYADLDGDGYGAGSATNACSQPAGMIADNTDCDDSNNAINSGATEICFNSIDDNCNTQVDENCEVLGCTDVTACNYDAAANTNDGSCVYGSDYYADADGDGFGTIAPTTLCSIQAGYVTNNTDCDDTNNAVNTAATEVCNSIDDNCDGFIDNGLAPGADLTLNTWTWTVQQNCSATPFDLTITFNANGTWFNNVGESGPWTLCENNFTLGFYDYITIYSGTLSNGVITGTYDNTVDWSGCFTMIENVPAIAGCTNPTACNYNASATADDGSCTYATDFYADLDGDGYGAGSATSACTQPAGYVTNNTDCDDSNNAINPNATEICGNGYDDDCDGTTDEVPGDANAWGQGEWLANVYNGVYFENYQGYYVRQGNSYNTESDFPWDGTPSNAAGYVGCAVPGDFHSVKYRRQGFPTSIYPYAITVPSWDDDVYVYVDGNLVWSAGCCGNGMTNNVVWTGNLNETSTVEVSFGEYSGASFLSFIVEPQYPLSITGSTAISNYACYNFNYYTQVTQSYGVDPSTMTYNVTSANGLIDVAAITPTFNGSEVIFNFSPNSIVGDDVITIAVADNMGFADTLVVNVNLTECPPPLQVNGSTDLYVDACTNFDIFVYTNSALGYESIDMTFVTTFSDTTFVQSTTPTFMDFWGTEVYMGYEANGVFGSTIATTVVTDPLGNSDTLVTIINFGMCEPVLDVDNSSNLISCGDSTVTMQLSYAFYNTPNVVQSVAFANSNNFNAVPNENIVLVSTSDTTLVVNNLQYFGQTYTYEITFANLGEWAELHFGFNDEFNYNFNTWQSVESIIDYNAPQLSSDVVSLDITLPAGVCDTLISWDEVLNPVNAFGANSTYITNQHDGTFYAAINGGNGLTTLGVDGNSGADCGGVLVDGNFTISTADGSSFEVYYANTLDTGDPSTYQMWFVPATESAVSTSVDYSICDHRFVLENLSGTQQSYFYYLFASQDGTTYDASVLQSVAQTVANNFSAYLNAPNGSFDLAGIGASMPAVVSNVISTILSDGNYYAIENDPTYDDNGLEVGINDGGGDIYDDANYIVTNFNDFYANGEQGGGIPYTNGQVAVGGPLQSDAMFTLNISETCDYTVTSSIPNGSSVGVGTTVIDFVVTDNSGNSSTYAITVNVTASGEEICNNIDDNCNSQVDEGLPLISYYADADGDGFGAGTAVESCSQPAGYVTTNTDCNDALAAVNPSVTENCSTSYDDNCNGSINEGCVSNLPGENPSNAISMATSVWPNCFSNVNSTLAGMSPSANAQTVCLTGEDKWYQFVATTEGVSILVNSIQNDILIELQTAAGTLVAEENAVSGIGTEILNHYGLTAGQVYKVGIRNYDSSLGIGTFSACVRMLKRGGCDSGNSPSWSNTLSLCQVYKATWPGSGTAVRYTFTGLTGTGAGNVYTKTQTGAAADQLILSTVTPTLPYGTTYNVLITNVYTLQDGAGNNEVLEVPALSPCTLNTIAEPVSQLRASDNCSSGPRFRSAVVASLPWSCGAINWRWEFVEVDGSNNPVGLPIYHLRNAASNYLNLGTV